MKRSSELKIAISNDLAKSVKEKSVTHIEEVPNAVRQKMIREKGHNWNSEDWDRYNTEVEKTQERNRELLALLETLLQKTNDLILDLESCSDEEFDQKYTEIERLLEDFNQIERSSSKESFTLSFVDIVSIESFEQYIKGRWPMQFIPHKEEVGRILALAKEAHSKRTIRDELSPAEPIKIVDIGGSNGALGKLVVDLAHENGLKIEYITIDPDQTTVQAASVFYHDDPALKFIPQTAEEYVTNLYEHNPDIKALIDLRKNRIQDGERKIKELKVYLAKIQADFFKLKKHTEQREAIEKHCRVLREDFGIELDPSSFSSYANFDDVFEVEYVYESDEVSGRIHYEQKYRDKVLQPEIDNITKQINIQLAKIPPTTDLTINSWMPPRMDLTADIQFVNSTTILYALERGGATGCQSNVAFSEKPTRLGDGESYRQGDNYNSIFGWKSHSVPQLQQMSGYRGKNVPFTERFIDYSGNPRGVENVFPYSNAFVVQIRKNVSIGTIDPDEAEIKIGEPYPWEQELEERGGDVQPIHKITDKNDTPDLSPLMK